MVRNSIGWHNVARHAHRIRVLRHYNTVAFAEHYVIFASRISQCFIQLDSDIICFSQLYFRNRNRVLAGSRLLCHFQHTLHSGTLILVYLAFQTRATHVCHVGYTPGLFYDFAQPFAFTCKSVRSAEHYLSVYLHILLFIISRTFPYIYFIERH